MTAIVLNKIVTGNETWGDLIILNKATQSMASSQIYDETTKNQVNSVNSNIISTIFWDNKKHHSGCFYVLLVDISPSSLHSGKPECVQCLSRSKTEDDLVIETLSYR